MVFLFALIFGFKDAELYVLLVKHGIGPTLGQWALPGSWIKYNESLDEAEPREGDLQTLLARRCDESR